MSELKLKKNLYTKKLDRYYHIIDVLMDNRKIILIEMFGLYGGLIGLILHLQKDISKFLFFFISADWSICVILVLILFHNHLNYITIAGKQFELETSEDPKELSILDYFYIYKQYGNSLLIELSAFVISIAISLFLAISITVLINILSTIK